MTKAQELELLHDFATYSARIMYCTKPEGVNIPLLTISMMSGRLKDCVAHLKEASENLCDKYVAEQEKTNGGN